MSTLHDDDNPIVRPFAAWLTEQSNGHTHEELGDGLHDLIARVRDTGKKGSITLTVTVAPMKENERMLILTDAIQLKLPEHDRKASIFYADANGNLVRNDPDQLEFNLLKEVPPPAGVDLVTGEVFDPPALKNPRKEA